MFLLLKEKGRNLFFFFKFLMAILKWPRRRAKASDSLKKEKISKQFTQENKRSCPIKSLSLESLFFSGFCWIWSVSSLVNNRIRRRGMRQKLPTHRPHNFFFFFFRNCIFIFFYDDGCLARRDYTPQPSIYGRLKNNKTLDLRATTTLFIKRFLLRPAIFFSWSVVCFPEENKNKYLTGARHLV